MSSRWILVWLLAGAVGCVSNSLDWMPSAWLASPTSSPRTALGLAGASAWPGGTPTSAEPPSPDARAFGDRPEVVLPGEYQPVERLIISFDDHVETYLLDIVEATWGQADLIVMIPDWSAGGWFADSMRERGLDPDRARFVRANIESPWIRDYGPLVVEHADGNRSVVDLRYCVDEPEDEVPRVLAEQLWPEWKYRRSSLCLDGGNLLSDGAGRCFTTAGYRDSEREFEDGDGDGDDARRTSVDVEFMTRELQQKLGCNDIFILPPLSEEPTGHVDMYLTLTGPGQALVGEYRVEDDWLNASRLDEVAETLRRRGVAVTRVPMADHQDGLFRSYTNSLAVGDVVLVPVYPESQADEQRALAIFRRAYPHRTIVPIVATDAIELQGAVHCTTMTVNRRSDDPWE